MIQFRCPRCGFLWTELSGGWMLTCRCENVKVEGSRAERKDDKSMPFSDERKDTLLERFRLSTREIQEGILLAFLELATRYELAFAEAHKRYGIAMDLFRRYSPGVRIALERRLRMGKAFGLAHAR